MKKIICAVLVFSLMLTFASCVSGEETDDGKIKIIASCFPAYDFAKQIAGEYASVELLLDPGEESHSFDVTPRDVIAISEADLFVCNGGRGEAWVETVISSLDRSDTAILKMTECCTLLGEDHGGGDHGGGAPAERYDEHVWTSPAVCTLIVEEIGRAIINADPEREDYYRGRIDGYKNELRALDGEFRELFSADPSHLIVVADRFPFAYFADSYSMNYVSAFEDCSSESEPSAEMVAALMDVLRAKDIKYVFYIEFSSRRVSGMLAEDCGVTELLLHSCHNVTKSELDGGATYLSLMRANLENLKLALAKN